MTIEPLDNSLEAEAGAATAKRVVKICNQKGLHARAAACFVKTAHEFDAEIWVRKNGTVAHVEANVPATTTDTPDVAIPNRLGVGTYVIELAGGEAALDGITPGTHLDVSHVGPSRD